MKYIFKASVDGGRLLIANLHKFKKYLVGNNGKDVFLTISDELPRTFSQNSYYWGVVVKTIADHTGDDKDSTHEYLKQEFAPHKIVEIHGQIIKIYKSTSKMTKKEFVEYVDKIMRWASHTLGVYIPSPDEVESPRYY